MTNFPHIFVFSSLFSVYSSAHNLYSTDQNSAFFSFKIQKSRRKHFPCKMAVKSIRTFLVDCDRARRCSSIRRHAPCPYSGASPRRPTQPPATVPTKELSFHACSSFRYDFSLFWTKALVYNPNSNPSYKNVQMYKIQWLLRIRKRCFLRKLGQRRQSFAKICEIFRPKPT